MRVHVALTPAEFPGARPRGPRRARRSTCSGRPPRSWRRARRAARASCPWPTATPRSPPPRGIPPAEVLLAGERGGATIAGFDLGNSPARVRRRSASPAARVDLHHDQRHRGDAPRADGRRAAARPRSSTWRRPRGGRSTRAGTSRCCARASDGPSRSRTRCARASSWGACSRRPGAAELTDAALAALRLGEHYAGAARSAGASSREWGRQARPAGAGRRPRRVPAARHVAARAGVRRTGRHRAAGAPVARPCRRRRGSACA